MKKTILIIAILLPLASFSQVQIEYFSFDAYRKIPNSQNVEFIRTIHKKGYFEINKAEATVIVYHDSSKSKELFEFIPFTKGERTDIEHYLGYGKKDSTIALNFIPEFKIISLKVNDEIIHLFQLNHFNASNIQREFNL